MCVVCVEWEKGKLTNNEAKRALFEMASDQENIKHYQDLYAKIEEKDEKEGAD